MLQFILVKPKSSLHVLYTSTPLKTCLLILNALPELLDHVGNMFWVFALEVFENKRITGEEMAGELNPCINSNNTVHFKKLL